MILALLLLAGVTIRPAAPAVGDLVTIDFPARAELAASADYEIVTQEGKRVVVRTFAPKPFAVRGTMNGEVFEVRVPVRSVLQPNDPMTPAPLAPPRPLPYPREPFIAIAVAALAAALAWTLVLLRARKKTSVPAVPAQTAEERFRAAVAAIAATRSWGRLADATRHYLAATRPGISPDLTTTELVPRLREEERFVAHILRQGDFEKFSRRKPGPEDFDEAVRRVLELAS